MLQGSYCPDVETELGRGRAMAWVYENLALIHDLRGDHDKAEESRADWPGRSATRRSTRRVSCFRGRSEYEDACFDVFRPLPRQRDRPRARHGILRIRTRIRGA